MSTFSERLVQASTDGQAAITASAVIDDLLPGGAAISIDAVELTGDVVDAFTGDHQFQAFVLAVMISVARWLGTWQRVSAPGPNIAALAAAEIEVHRVLQDFVHAQHRALVSDDPEIRSLLYRLTGMVTDPAVAVEYVRQFLESEESPLARACAFEGLAVAVMRSPSELHDEAVLLRNAIQGDALVASRVANAPYDYVGGGDGANLQALEEILGAELPNRDYESCWPSELL